MVGRPGSCLGNCTILDFCFATVPTFSSVSDVLSFAVRPDSYLTAFREDSLVLPRVRLKADAANVLDNIVSIRCIGY